MAKRNRDLGEAGTGAVTAGSGQASGSADPVTPARGGAVVDRVVPAHLACRVGARARAGERDAWPAVVAIALGTFALVFSELIPVGLLADISGHLGVSIGAGGLMVVVPAVAAAVAAPLLALCSGPAGAAQGAGHPERAGPGLRRDRRPRAGHRGDARGPRRAGSMRGRVAGSAAGGVIYDAKGPGGVLVLAAAVAAAGSLALLGRAGASISSPPAGSADPARERGRERRHRRTTRPVGAGNTALRPR